MARSSPQTGPTPDRAHHPADRFIAIYMRLSDASRRTAAQESSRPVGAEMVGGPCSTFL